MDKEDLYSDIYEGLEKIKLERDSQSLKLQELKERNRLLKVDNLYLTNRIAVLENKIKELEGGFNNAN